MSDGFIGTEDHPDPDLAGPGMGVWHVADLQHLRRITEFIEDSGFHFFPSSPARCPRLSSVQHLENRPVESLILTNVTAPSKPPGT